jgi:hypothetical protein
VTKSSAQRSQCGAAIEIQTSPYSIINKDPVRARETIALWRDAHEDEQRAKRSQNSSATRRLSCTSGTTTPMYWGKEIHMPKEMMSVGDVAFELEIHEREVREWAEENDVPEVGREFIFSGADFKRLEDWLEEQTDEEDDDDDADDDEEVDDDDESPEPNPDEE